MVGKNDLFSAHNSATQRGKILKDINWEDMKMVYHVALSGSLQKAANNLKINYSTVLRHIDRVEKSLGCKLFLRHQRGYQLTDACRTLMAEMPAIESAFRQLQQKLLPQEEALKGILKISTLPEYSTIIHPVVQRSMDCYPDLKILVDVNDDVDFLETGQTHIAIRAGLAPQTGDLIFNRICDLSYSYYASMDYIKKKGMPSNPSQYSEHAWVMPSGRKRKISFVKNVLEDLDDKYISYESNDFHDIQSAICHGLGIGPVDDYKAKALPELKKVQHIKDDSNNSLWFVYHRDLRDDVKVTALWDLFKEMV